MFRTGATELTSDSELFFKANNLGAKDERISELVVAKVSAVALSKEATSVVVVVVDVVGSVMAVVEAAARRC